MKRSKRKLKQAKGKGSGQTFVDRNIAATDPNKEQFAPTEADPIKLHHRMAGIG